jgi:hypothetical protein
VKWTWILSALVYICHSLAVWHCIWYLPALNFTLLHLTKMKIIASTLQNGDEDFNQSESRQEKMRPSNSYWVVIGHLEREKLKEKQGDRYRQTDREMNGPSGLAPLHKHPTLPCSLLLECHLLLHCHDCNNGTHREPPNLSGSQLPIFALFPSLLIGVVLLQALCWVHFSFTGLTFCDQWPRGRTGKSSPGPGSCQVYKHSIGASLPHDWTWNKQIKQILHSTDSHGKSLHRERGRQQSLEWQSNLAQFATDLTQGRGRTGAPPCGLGRPASHTQSKAAEGTGVLRGEDIWARLHELIFFMSLE